MNIIFIRNTCLRHAGMCLVWHFFLVSFFSWFLHWKYLNSMFFFELKMIQVQLFHMNCNVLFTPSPMVFISYEILFHSAFFHMITSQVGQISYDFFVYQVCELDNFFRWNIFQMKQIQVGCFHMKLVFFDRFPVTNFLFWNYLFNNLKSMFFQTKPLFQVNMFFV